MQSTETIKQQLTIRKNYILNTTWNTWIKSNQIYNQLPIHLTMPPKTNSYSVEIGLCSNQLRMVEKPPSAQASFHRNGHQGTLNTSTRHRHPKSLVYLALEMYMHSAYMTVFLHLINRTPLPEEMSIGIPQRCSRLRPDGFMVLKILAPRRLGWMCFFCVLFLVGVGATQEDLSKIF